jgi:hypothetical protein
MVVSNSREQSMMVELLSSIHIDYATFACHFKHDVHKVHGPVIIGDSMQERSGLQIEATQLCK